MPSDIQPSPRPFELEVLEPRILLSADGVTPHADAAVLYPNSPLAVLAEANVVAPNPVSDSLNYDPAEHLGPLMPSQEQEATKSSNAAGQDPQDNPGGLA